MQLEDIPAFQEQMRLDITSASMRVYHPREFDKTLDRYREFLASSSLVHEDGAELCLWGLFN